MVLFPNQPPNHCTNFEPCAQQNALARPLDLLRCAAEPNPRQTAPQTAAAAAARLPDAPVEEAGFRSGTWEGVRKEGRRRGREGVALNGIDGRARGSLQKRNKIATAADREARSEVRKRDTDDDQRRRHLMDCLLPAYSSAVSLQHSLSSSAILRRGGQRQFVASKWRNGARAAPAPVR